MMGWAERGGQASEQLLVARYRVRRWTGFEWSDIDADAPTAQREAAEEARKHREQHLERIAGIVERKLIEIRPRMEPRCVRVRIDRVPQLMFELTLKATDEDDARKRAMYVIGRALSAKLPSGRGRRDVALSPPWGKVEVEQLKAQVHAIG